MCNSKFIALCREAIARWYKEKKNITISEHQVGVVWISKTLQNNKGLFATFGIDDQYYFEMTRNGDKCETYMDVYDKQENIVLPY